jgi:hypothetical protein
MFCDVWSNTEWAKSHFAHTLLSLGATLRLNVFKEDVYKQVRATFNGNCNLRKHVNVLCGQNVEFLNVKRGVMWHCWVLNANIRDSLNVLIVHGRRTLNFWLSFHSPKSRTSSGRYSSGSSIPSRMSFFLDNLRMKTKATATLRTSVYFYPETRWSGLNLHISRVVQKQCWS